MACVDDLYALPDDLFRHELQTGLLISEPPPGFRHGLVAARICSALHAYVRDHRLGAVSADAGYVLARAPDTVRAPDVSFVARARLEQGSNPAGAFAGHPDLAVEILSPSNTPTATHAKVADYLAAGTRLVWVIDPERRAVAVYRSLLAPSVLFPDRELDGEDVVPGFRLSVAALFEE